MPGMAAEKYAEWRANRNREHRGSGPGALVRARGRSSEEDAQRLPRRPKGDFADLHQLPARAVLRDLEAHTAVVFIAPARHPNCEGKRCRHDPAGSGIRQLGVKLAPACLNDAPGSHAPRLYRWAKECKDMDTHKVATAKEGGGPYGKRSINCNLEPSPTYAYEPLAATE